MIIRRVILQNFGIYKGEHIINWENADPSKVVTLIGGLNGRGKTTFLDAIILGLYGHRALRYLQDEKIKYSTYIENHVSKGIPAGSQTMIELTLQRQRGDDDCITICRSWDKKLVGISDEKLIVYRNGYKDEILSNSWDYFVEEILPLTISRFFFFDNEKISQIADDESFDSVKDSIKAFLGFTTIDQLISDMGKISKKYAHQSDGAEKNELVQELNQIQQAIDESQRKAKEAFDDANDFSAKIKQLREQLENENEQFWKNGGNLGLERNKLEAEKKASEASIAQFANMARDCSQDASIPLLLCKPLLENIRVQQLDGERQRTRRYFDLFVARIRDLLSETSDHSAAFSEEMMGLLEQLSTEYQTGRDEANVAGMFFADTHLRIKAVLDSVDQKNAFIADLLENLAKYRSQLEQIDSHLDREFNEAAARQARNAMTEISDQIIRLEVDKRMADSRLAQYEKERERLKNQKALAVAKSMKVKLGNSEAERIVKYANLVIQTMERFKENLVEQKLQELSDRILACFMSMVQKDSMIQNIAIDPATLDIKLVDYLGGELLKSQLSAGEKQLFAVSIIWGLAQCSGYDMPVVIDTPLGRLDSQHRSSFVEGYLPHAGKQVIVLSTDEEIYGKYYDLLHPYVDKEYTLVYNEDSKSSSIEPGYSWGEKNDREAD